MGSELVLARAVLGRLAGEIDLDEQLDSAIRGERRLIELVAQLRAVDGVDGVEALGGLPRLVGLQVADEMPAQRQIGEAIHLLNRFLDLVLAEVDLAGVSRRPNVVGVEGFRNGDEADGGRIAPGAIGGARDAFANTSQSSPKRWRSQTL